MKKFFGLFFSFVLFLSLAGTASAAIGLPDYLRPENLPSASRTSIGENPDTYGARGVQYIIGDIISIILLIAGVLTVFQIVNNGWWLVISAGKGEAIDQRKKALFWNVIGLVLILLSYIIIRFTIKFVTTAFSEPPGQVQTEQTAPPTPSSAQRGPNP